MNMKIFANNGYHIFRTISRGFYLEKYTKVLGTSYGLKIIYMGLNAPGFLKSYYKFEVHLIVRFVL